MVSRKPVGSGQKVDTNTDSGNKPSLPYPVTPIDSSTKPADNTNNVYSPDLARSPAFDLIGMDEARSKERRESVSTNGTWDSDDSDEWDKPDESEIPKSLRPAPGQQGADEGAKKQENSELPAILRPGPAEPSEGRPQDAGSYEDQMKSNPWASSQNAPQSQQQQGGRMESNNPYLPYKQQRPQLQETDSGQSIWGDVPIAPPPQPDVRPPQPPSQAEPAELPTAHTPNEEMSAMSLNNNEQSYPRGSYYTAEVLPVPQQGQPPYPEENANNPNPWQQQQPTAQDKWGDNHAPRQSSNQLPYPTDDAWGSSTTLPQTPLYPGDQHHAPPRAPPSPQTQTPSQPPHNLMDDEPTPEQPPPFAPVQESEPPQTHRPADVSIAQPSDPRSANTAPETPNTHLQRQKNEHYQIKHINWLDQSISGSSEMRQSPILTQNENGPCPLLALVNALVLSTPKSLDTALVETLRTREQVSLGLLLDAVFDELMSGRRGDTATELPDVSELYSFLVTLHTGMNVNPRFVTPVNAPRGSFDGHPAGSDGIHPIHRAQNKPGCFEETKEMELYSTFSIPLLHGWTTPKGTPAYTAFERSAPTFEDAQNIQFALPDLEQKLETVGLSEQETQQLQDIQTIKQFLTNWPTQLTDHGLNSINTSLRPGQIAILFRNDHFSTIYKEPRHGALMTLVTDAGYSSHAEIVWESLVDVNGAASELFSGDFRTVSHNDDARLNQNSSAGGDEGWQTVPSSPNRNRQNQHSSEQQQFAPPPGPPPSHSSNTETAPALPGPRPDQRQPASNATTTPPPPTSAAEQEDHDLALALQLQEEEEDRNRQASAQRRREAELSEQYLERESTNPNPNNTSSTSPTNPPAQPPRPSTSSNTAAGTPERPPIIPPRRTSARPPTSPPPAASTVTTGAPTGAPAGEEGTDLPPPSYDQAWQDRPYRPGSQAQAPSVPGNGNGSVGQGDALGAYEALRAQQQGLGNGNGNGSGQGMGRRRSGQGLGNGGYGGQGQGGGGTGAAGVRDAEERCSVM
ncbi:hypothetical protein MBLNU230_g2746t1 [Neophaeotheca triangularis]